MSPRTGRPKVENPKINLTIRLDVETEEQLRRYCDENNITRGEAVRKALQLLLGRK